MGDRLMSWGRLYSRVRGDPKIRKLARRLSIEVPHALGLIVSLWAWCLEHRPDGCLANLDAEDIAIAAEWSEDHTQLHTALMELGFIDPIEGICYIHDWDDFAGSWKESQRKKLERANKSKPRPKMSRTVLDNPKMSHNREEERRGEVPEVPRPKETKDNLEINQTKEKSPQLDKPADGPSAAVLVFPTRGQQKTWVLFERQAVEWEKSYEGLNVRLEIMKAYNWCDANVGKRKTATGMKAFLVNWLNRATDDQGKPSAKSSPAKRLTQSERIAQIARDMETEEEIDERNRSNEDDGRPLELLPGGVA